MGSDPLVLCVVLNWNRCDDTLECLRSLHDSTYTNLRILVLDCESTEECRQTIREAFRDVRVLELSKNFGYAGNNNVGIRKGFRERADWILVLNEDTVLARDCLATLVEVGERDPNIGILGPLVYHYDEPNVIQSAGGRIDRFWRASHSRQNVLDDGSLREPRAVQWISGCAILVRRDMVTDVGALDERFFAYWEETEWCIRAARGGWRIVNVPAAKIWHKGVKRNYQPKPEVTYYLTRNHLLALSTHRAPLAARVVVWSRIAGTLASWTLRPKWREKRAHRDAMWQAVLDFMHGRWGPRRVAEGR